MRVQLIFLAFLLVLALAFAGSVQNKVKALAQADDVSGKEYIIIIWD